MYGLNINASSENKIKNLIGKKSGMIKLSLSICMHCSICSDSCFLFRSHNNDPTYTPSYKAIHSIGKIFKKKGKLTDKDYKEIGDLVWNKCVLCTRCYCPVGIRIHSLIATARTVCREKGFYRTYDSKKAT